MKPIRWNKGITRTIKSKIGRLVGNGRTFVIVMIETLGIRRSIRIYPGSHCLKGHPYDEGY